MKSFRKELTFNIPSRRAFVNITPQVEEALRESGIREGLILVNTIHMTASVFINNDESDLQDYDRRKNCENDCDIIRTSVRFEPTDFCLSHRSSSGSHESQM